jgi:hypothetical protein
MTQAGMILGTAAYMSPEQARGSPADKRADIWAYGAVLFEMLTGRAPFGGETISDTLASVLKTDPDWRALPPATPPSIRRLLRRCLERDRKRRLPDIGVARLEIDEAAAAPEPASAPPVARGNPRWWIAAVAALSLALAAISAIHFRESPPQPVTVRFQILAQKGALFGNDPPVVSPDGRRIAFIDAGASRGFVWVRSLDSLESHALPGTQGASDPFWSPDSRFPGFFAGGQIKKIDVSGGPPQTLFPIPADYGAAWGRDGTILFGSRQGLMRVPQAGGEPVPVTKIDAARHEVSQSGPRFLPDGRHFLYLSHSGSQGNAIYLGSLDRAESKRLASVDGGAAYSPPAAGGKAGHLLFLRENTLMAQPVDPRSFNPVGDAFPVAERVGNDSGGEALFTVSDNGVLVYRVGGSGTVPVDLVRPGRKAPGTRWAAGRL